MSKQLSAYIADVLEAEQKGKEMPRGMSVYAGDVIERTDQTGVIHKV